MSPQDALQQIRDLISRDCGGRRDDAMIAQVRRLLSYMPADLTIYARGKCSSIQRWAECIGVRASTNATLAERSDLPFQFLELAMLYGVNWKKGKVTTL